MKMITKIGELLLIPGMILSVGGALGYVTRQLPAGQIPGIGALAFMFIVTGAGMKQKKCEQEE